MDAQVLRLPGWKVAVEDDGILDQPAAGQDAVIPSRTQAPPVTACLVQGTRTSA